MSCGAKTRAGGLCKKPGMLNGRCRLHGGLSPKGQDHWNYRHGKDTKVRRENAKQTLIKLKFIEQLLAQFNML